MADSKYNPGDRVFYNTLPSKSNDNKSEKKEYTVEGMSEDKKGGYVLKDVKNQNIQFALSPEGNKRIIGYAPPSSTPSMPSAAPPVTIKKKYVPPTVTPSRPPPISPSPASPPAGTPPGGGGGTPPPAGPPPGTPPAGPGKFRKGLKKVGKGAAAAAGAVGGYAIGAARGAGRAIGGPGNGIDDSTSSFGLVILFIISIGVQFADFWTGYQRPGGLMIYAIPVLLVISFFVYDMTFDSRILQFSVVLIVAYFLPYIGQLLPDSQATLIVNGLFFWLPVIVLYLGLKFPKGQWPRIVSILVLIFWILAAMFTLIESFNPDISTKQLVKDPMAGVRYVTSSVGTVFTKASTSITDTFNRAVAEATGQPYIGDQESRVGIYVENVRGLETRYTNMSNVYVEATIKAENLKEPVDVNTICYIDNIGPGLASPTMIYNVSDNYENIIGCSFGRLAAGVYNVKVRINFQFETSSDIKYTFVNSGIKSNQFEKLNIDPKTVATYTGGPVELGLPSLTQPLRVDVIPGSNTQLSTYPFGVSLRNIWPQGQIIKGIIYMLDVPKEINLVDCSRNSTTASGQNATNLRNYYYFEVDKANARDKFDAIQCRMNIIDVKNLMGADLKSERTFAARVRYEYAVEGQTTIIVEQN